MDKEKDDCHFNIGHAVKHLTNFRETGDLKELKECNRLLEEHLKHLEHKKGD